MSTGTELLVSLKDLKLGERSIPWFVCTVFLVFAVLRNLILIQINWFPNEIILAYSSTICKTICDE